MRMYDVILKKRNGGELSKEEIDFFIQGYTKGSIPDYQASALLMAIYFKKMSKKETVDLTMSMVDSGDKLDLSGVKGIKVDKHSTGGVGDKTSLVLGPMVAACGIPVGKMSGRGLGHTGGTVDKLESIKGFSVEMTKEQFVNNVNTIGLAIGGQTTDLAPADKKLYSLRDVTATVDNISLIASSIMSKKIASGSDAIVLDVKVGSGAFMKDIESAFELGEEMVDIGCAVGKKTVAVVSDMDQPLGRSVGNALEVKEAIDTLRGKGPEDLMELCLTLGSHMLMLAGKTKDEYESRKILKNTIESGTALTKFKEFVKAQGGDTDMVDSPELLPHPSYIIDLRAEKEGFVERITTDQVGIASLILGAGRETKESILDLSAGIILNKKVGDSIARGDSIATIYANDKDKIELCKQRLLSSFRISHNPAASRQIIYGTVTDKGRHIFN